MNNINQDNTSPLIKFTPGRDDTFSAGSRGADMGTRPTSDPRSAKSFKKVMEKGHKSKDKDDDIKIMGIEDEEEQELEIADANEEEETVKNKAPLSLFDLSGSVKSAPVDKSQGKFAMNSGDKAAATPINSDLDTEEKEEVESGKLVKNKKPESPSDVFSKMTTTHAHPITEASSSKVASKKENFTSRFATEQSDLSYVNPMAPAAQPMGEVYLKVEKPVLPVSNIQEIINQLVEKVVEMKDQGRTDTIVTLKQPPTLAGANLVVTSFDSAKGEFNISFENLTQAAKNLLDQRVNQDALKLALEKKGYAVHIVTTTTLVENRPIAEPAHPQQSRDEENREDRRRGGGRQRRQGEELA